MSAAIFLPSRMGIITLRSMIAMDSSFFSIASLAATSCGSGRLRVAWLNTGILIPMKQIRAVIKIRKRTPLIFIERVSLNAWPLNGAATVGIVRQSGNKVADESYVAFRIQSAGDDRSTNYL